MLDHPGPAGPQRIATMATRNATFSPEELKKVIDEAIAEHEARKAQQTQQGDTAKAHSAIINAFIKAGYKREAIVLFDKNKTLAEQPNVTVLIYAKWMELGRKVKTGEHSIKPRGSHMRLFHRDQTEVATVPERKQYFKDQQDKLVRKEARKAGKGQQQATA